MKRIRSSRKILINAQNIDDNRLFKQSLIRCIILQVIIQQGLGADKNFARELNFKGIRFDLLEKVISKNYK